MIKRSIPTIVFFLEFNRPAAVCVVECVVSTDRSVVECVVSTDRSVSVTKTGLDDG
jgi:hypothetical protein